MLKMALVDVFKALRGFGTKLFPESAEVLCEIRIVETYLQVFREFELVISAYGQRGTGYGCEGLKPLGGDLCLCKNKR